MRYRDLVDYLSTIDSKNLPGESAHQALIPLIDLKDNVPSTVTTTSAAMLR
jgi:hypothetical protein